MDHVEKITNEFYDNSILPGTKTYRHWVVMPGLFYDNSILPGTKTDLFRDCGEIQFYDNSILPGTKTSNLPPFTFNTIIIIYYIFNNRNTISKIIIVQKLILHTIQARYLPLINT